MAINKRKLKTEIAVINLTCLSPHLDVTASFEDGVLVTGVSAWKCLPVWKRLLHVTQENMKLTQFLGSDGPTNHGCAEGPTTPRNHSFKTCQKCRGGSLTRQPWYVTIWHKIPVHFTNLESVCFLFWTDAQKACAILPTETLKKRKIWVNPCFVDSSRGILTSFWSHLNLSEINNLCPKANAKVTADDSPPFSCSNKVSGDLITEMIHLSENTNVNVFPHKGREGKVEIHSTRTAADIVESHLWSLLTFVSHLEAAALKTVTHVNAPCRQIEATRELTVFKSPFNRNMSAKSAFLTQATFCQVLFHRNISRSLNVKRFWIIRWQEHEIVYPAPAKNCKSFPTGKKLLFVTWWKETATACCVNKERAFYRFASRRERKHIFWILWIETAASRKRKRHLLHQMKSTNLCLSEISQNWNIAWKTKVLWTLVPKTGGWMEVLPQYSSFEMWTWVDHNWSKQPHQIFALALVKLLFEGHINIESGFASGIKLDTALLLSCV